MIHRQPLPALLERKGIVLLAVLVVVALLGLAAYQYSELMSSKYKEADSFQRSLQARAFADSGVHYVAALLSDPNSLTNTLNNNPYDNASVFQWVPVNGQDDKRSGGFTIVAPLGPDDLASSSQPFRYGVTDESGKFNLNALLQLDSSGKIAHDILIQLPNMTEDVVNSILDWIDPDNDPRSDGAESDYYSGLNPPYLAKNGPLNSMEELLLVKGVTPPLLLGNDLNRNGILDAGEDDGTGQINLGLSAYLTIYSREPNVDATGNPRLFINDSDLTTLANKLQAAVGNDLANFIIAYRQYGPAQQPRGGATTPGRGSPGVGRGSLNLTVAGGRQARSISSLYELINTGVSIPGSNPRSPPTYYPSPLNDSGNLRQYLPVLLDKTTTTQDTELPARINVNTASRAVIKALPGIQDADVQAILDHRPISSTGDASDPIFQTPAWLITEANMKPDTLRTLDKYITARSRVFRVQAVGRFAAKGPSARVEAVFDTNNGHPRILFYRDLTELGKGYDLSGPSNVP